MNKILLVEGSLVDTNRIESALNLETLDIDLQTVRDGTTALKLMTEGAPGEIPDLVLLDLSDPSVSGLEVLESMRQHEALESVPVVVMSSFPSSEDIIRAYRLGANSCIRKPSDLKEFNKIITITLAYWFGTVTRPALSSAN